MLMRAERQSRNNLFTAGAATVAALLYAARSGQALTAGELDHMAHSVSSGQPLVIAAAAAMAVALLGLRASMLPSFEGRNSRPSVALLIAAAGLLWIAMARLIELLGATGPWGLYSGPGLVAFLSGLAVAGISLTSGQKQTSQASSLGRVIMAITLLHLAAGLVSMVLFNVLGRGIDANVAATQAGHAFRLLETLCWLGLAVCIVRPKVFPATHSAA